MWFIVGFVIPVGLLTFCNVNLILALRKSYRMRKQLFNVRMRNGNGTGRGNTGRNITSSLVAVIIVFTVLVVPADICSFLFYVIRRNPNHTEKFLFAITLTNFMKTLNFSINFLLYSAVNEKFRNTLREIFQKRRARRSNTGRNYNIDVNKDNRTLVNDCLVRHETTV